MIAAAAIAAAIAASAAALAAALSAGGSLRRAENARALASAPGPEEERPKTAGGALSQAGLATDRGTWAVLLAALAAACALVGATAFGPAGIAAAPLGPAAATLWLKSRAKRRMAMFDEQLARALPLVAESMRGGGSTFERSLAAAAKTADEPLKSELEACAAAMSADGDVVAAIRDMGGRTGSKDVAMLAAAVECGRELGGSYADTLGQIAGAIDARIAMRRHVESETAAAKASAKALTGMPIALLAILCAMSPESAAFFFGTAAGLACLAAVAALLVAGTLLINKISDMKID